jgi:hypothetical protein
MRGPRSAVLLVCIVAVAATARVLAAQPQPAAAPWPEADALFRRDPGWLGGDAIYSVDLGGERVLWLFGDSFVALDGSGDRTRAAMVRNTIALQRGRDPARATLAFHWRETDGKAAPFFANDGAIGHWPLHGHRVPGGPLLLFQTLVRDTPGKGLGFAIDGWRLLRVDAPDREPAAWTPRVVPFANVPRGTVFGTATVVDGEHLVVLGTRGDGPHRGVLARLELAALARGDGAPLLEVLAGGAWVPARADTVLDDVVADAGPECSLDRVADRWVHVASRGFGATTIAARAAAALPGPWTEPLELFTPPESRAAKPFVYAGKAHPALAAGDGFLAVSYATNAFAFGDLFTQQGQAERYWPRFWRVPIAALPAAPAPPSPVEKR